MTDDHDPPTKAELEQRVNELEQTIQKMLPSRRDALKLGGGALTGAGLMEATTNGAKAGSQSVGTIGTTSDPVDLVAEDFTDHNGNDVMELPGDGSVSIDEVTVTNGLVAGEKIGSDSGKTSSLSVSVNPDNWSQIKIHIVSTFVSSSDFLLSTDGSGGYRGHFNDDSTFDRTDGLPILIATNSITPTGTVTVTPDPTRGGFAVGLDVFFPQSQSRISNFAITGGYSLSDYSQLSLENLDSTESQEMIVYGVE
jgi:hypothetical protein